MRRKSIVLWKKTLPMRRMIIVLKKNVFVLKRIIIVLRISNKINAVNNKTVNYTDPFYTGTDHSVMRSSDTILKCM